MLSHNYDARGITFLGDADCLADIEEIADRGDDDYKIGIDKWILRRIKRKWGVEVGAYQSTRELASLYVRGDRRGKTVYFWSLADIREACECYDTDADIEALATQMCYGGPDYLETCEA